jgi:hypothetical protein
MIRSRQIVIGVALSVSAMAGAAQERTPPPESRDTEVNEHAIILEFGAAGDSSRVEGFQPGGTFAFEVTLIENWLELEVGVSAMRSATGAEIPIDILFKKP